MEEQLKDTISETQRTKLELKEANEKIVELSHGDEELNKTREQLK